MDWQTIAPKSPAHYLITVERPNGSRFVGYAFFDGRYWLTNNKQGRMHLNIVAWAAKPAPYAGPQGSWLIPEHMRPLDRYEATTYGTIPEVPDPWETNFTRAQQSKISKLY